MKYLIAALATAVGIAPSAAAPPAVPADTPNTTHKVFLQHQEAARLLRALGRAPAGTTSPILPEHIVVLEYPLDNSLIVRGPEAEVSEFERILRVIDVPLVTDGGHVTLWITPYGANPERVQKSALTLPGAGTVLLDNVRDKRLVGFRDGTNEWRDAVVRLVVEQEHAAASAAPAKGAK